MAPLGVPVESSVAEQRPRPDPGPGILLRLARRFLSIVRRCAGWAAISNDQENVADQSTPPRIVVGLNCFEELKGRVPAH